jgi:hypothetical protein
MNRFAEADELGSFQDLPERLQISLWKAGVETIEPVDSTLFELLSAEQVSGCGRGMAASRREDVPRRQHQPGMRGRLGRGRGASGETEQESCGNGS